MSISLFDLTQNEVTLLEPLIERLQEEQGLSYEQAVEQAVSAIDNLTKEKVIGYAVVIKNWQAEAEAIEKEVTRLKQRQQAKENATERLKARMVELLDHTQKWEGPEARVSFRRSESIDIQIGLEHLPIDCIRTQPETKSADKAKLKELIKAGHEIPGVKVKENWSVVIK